MSGDSRAQTPERRAGVIHAVLDAVARGDVDGVLELLHPEIEWYPPEQGTLDPVYEGHPAVRRLFRQLFDVWARIEHAPIEDTTLGATTILISHVLLEGRQSGVRVDETWGYAVELEAGRVRTVRMYTNPQDAIAFAEEARGERSL